ncbi:hypothetical protein GQ600_27755 [Phytophthora cactorum]|nr:hypothetical protein GQ600_27755 [Phytophthora cactorum]
MVMPVGKILCDSEITARVLSFKSVCRELRGQGWTCKPPGRRTLDDRYFYIRPGGSTREQEGVDHFRGGEAVLEYYANARTAPLAAPDNAQLAAAAEVVRRTYAADIEAAEARALASRDVGATATSPTPAIEAPATQAAVPQAPTRRAETDTAATQAALSTCPPPLVLSLLAKGKRPARRSLVCSLSPMPSTPPRPVCSSSPRPLRSSPHVQDSDVVSVSDDVASDDTMIPDNDVVESLYTPSDDEHDIDGDNASGGLGSELLADSGDSLNSVADGDAAPQFGSMDSGNEGRCRDWGVQLGRRP